MKKAAKKTVAKKATRKNASKKAGAGRVILSRYDYLMGTDNRFMGKDWEAVKKHFKGKCVYCGKKEGETAKLVKDHAIPINNQSLGMSRLGNIVPACEACNSSKGGKHFERFCRQGAKRGSEAETEIKEYMKSVGYKRLGRNRAERVEIQKIISDALGRMSEIRSDAIAAIEKIVSKKTNEKKSK